MDSIYYRVNHIKKLEHFDNADLAKRKSTLFYELSSKNESNINSQISKIFNSLVIDYQSPKSKDKLFLIYSLTEEYKRMKNIQLENYDKISLNVCKKLLEKDFKMTLNFNSENINDICTLMSLGFTKLFSTNKIKFKTYESFVKEIQIYRSLFIDLIRIYKSYNYILPARVPEIPRNTIPNEILLLMEIFQRIKYVKLSLKDYNKEKIIPYLIILLNYDWLFPFVFEIDLDLSYEKITDEVMRLYYLKEKNAYIKTKQKIMTLKSEIINIEDNNALNNLKNINLIKKDIIDNYENRNWKLLEQTNVPYGENNNEVIYIDKIPETYFFLLKKNIMIFDINLCFHYLIKEVKYLKSLSINMPNGFIKENIDSLRLKNIPELEAPNINIFEYLTIISSLNSFNITFNALEQKTFVNILFIIQNNGNLKEIKMEFFPNDYKKMTSQNLLKIAEESGITKKILSSRKDTMILSTTSDNEKYIKQKILEKFEVNLEKLFLLFQTKKHLEKIELIINIPFILYDNKGYHWTILKFLFNILILLKQEKFFLKEFKMALPFFNMDNRKYPIIGEFIEKFNLNQKLKDLKNFYFKANIFKLNNIRNLIPYNLSSLHLGELDLDTFKAFLELYHSDEYLEKSPLNSIFIELNKTVIKYKKCKSALTNFISGKNPKNLRELSFKCYFRIKRKDLYELLIKGNGNRIVNYNIFMNLENKNYDKIINHNVFYYLNDELDKKINNFIPGLRKYNLIDISKKNITKKILKFLLPSNRKKICITDIE